MVGGDSEGARFLKNVLRNNLRLAFSRYIRKMTEETVLRVEMLY